MPDGMTFKDSPPLRRYRPTLGPRTLSRRDAEAFDELAAAARKGGDRVLEMYCRDIAKLRRRAAEGLPR